MTLTDWAVFRVDGDKLSFRRSVGGVIAESLNLLLKDHSGSECGITWLHRGDWGVRQKKKKKKMWGKLEAIECLSSLF